jgi:hypothetical protein
MVDNSILKNLVEILSQSIKPGMLSGDSLVVSDSLLIAFYRAKLSLENKDSIGLSLNLGSPLVMQTCKRCYAYAMSPSDYKDAVCPCCGEAY